MYTVNRKELASALKTLGAVVPRRTYLPVLEHIETRGLAAESTLALTATDLDVRVTLSLPAQFTTDGTAACVPFRALADFVKSATGETVTVAGGDKAVVVTSGGASVTLATLSAEEFPSRFGPERWPTGFVMDGRNLEGLAEVAPFASTEESRPILSGVLWQVRQDGHTFVATNGHRLAKVTAHETLPIGFGERPDVILSTTTAELMASIADRAAVSIAPEHISIIAPTIAITARLIEGPYPNYSQVFPRDLDRAATFNTKPILATLKRLKSVWSKETARIRFDFAPGAVTVTAGTPDGGQAVETLPVAYEGEPIAIGFNGKYVAGLLPLFGPEVRWRFAAPEKASQLEPASGNGRVALLMPLRLVD